MPGRYGHSDAAEEEWEDDRDAPQERDVDDASDAETPTVPCPHCRRPVPDFADRCPYCGDWIVQSAGPPARHSTWFMVVVVVAIVLIVVFWVL